MSSSLSAKFIATVTPIFICVFILFVGIYEWSGYQKARRELIQHLDTMAASQSIILAESLASKDTGQLSVLLASIISDPDLIGVEVYDSAGQILDFYGETRGEDDELVKSISVNFADDRGVRAVGKLTLTMTERNLLAALQESLIDDALLAVALLVSGLIGAVFAHRRIVGRPLEKLLAAINETSGGRRGEVDWHSSDEIGDVIKSYNEMQRRLDNYERDLKAAHDQLEQRVEERTRDLVAAREVAERASRVKSKFLSSMSHEFRTPMNAVLGFTQILQTAPEIRDNPRLHDRFSKIENSARSLMVLIDEIMEFARLESDADDLLIENVRPLDAVNDAVSLIAPLAESRQVTLNVETGGQELAPIRADTLRLRTALLNLLSNAVKYNRSGGTVNIGIEQLGTRTQISVSDTGHGIPADQFDNIYEPFNRLGREAGSIEGSGIGLTMTQRIIEKMDGTIDFESVEGVGTTFRISLPATP